jgi:cation diffusion facilitator family transporter
MVDRSHEHRHDHEEDAHADHELARRNVRGLVGRLLGHSHTGTDRVDAALESSTEGIRALKVSLVVLGVTALAQTGVLILSGSVALLGDTLHNFADALTAVPLWVAFRLGRRPATRRYTYGYGRAEDLAGIVIVLIIAASAVFTGYEAVDRLVHPRAVEHLRWVALAGLVGCVGNETAAHYRIRTGRRIGSAALVADGLHARSDGLTSLAVVAGVVGVALGFDAADPLAGLFVAVVIALVGRNAARDVYARVLDSVSPELLARAHHVIVGTPGVREVETLRMRWIGHKLHVEAEITVDATLSLVEAHGIAHDAHHRLLHELPGTANVIVHTSPGDATGTDYHGQLAHHTNGIPHHHQ